LTLRAAVLSSGLAGPLRRRRVGRRFLGQCGLEHEPDAARTGGREGNGEAFATSAPRVTLNRVRVTQADIARIPATNIRVRRDDFAALWAAAEQLCDEQGVSGVTDWYAGGVAATCEWLAAAVFRPAAGPRQDACSPATGRSARAYEELIDAECVAVERLLLRRPPPAWLRRRPGWAEGIDATLRWAWRCSGPPPLRTADLDTG
jgi:hypothetical protein